MLILIQVAMRISQRYCFQKLRVRLIHPTRIKHLILLLRHRNKKLKPRSKFPLEVKDASQVKAIAGEIMAQLVLKVLKLIAQAKFQLCWSWETSRKQTIFILIEQIKMMIKDSPLHPQTLKMKSFKNLKLSYRSNRKTLRIKRKSSSQSTPL